MSRVSQPVPDTALLVRQDIARNGQQDAGAKPVEIGGQGAATETQPSDNSDSSTEQLTTTPKRFYGVVELDTTRPIRAFEQVVEAVVAQLQHTSGTKVTLTQEVEAVSDNGFSDGDVDIVRDNAKQLRFRPESTGFE